MLLKVCFALPARRWKLHRHCERASPALWKSFARTVKELPKRWNIQFTPFFLVHLFLFIAKNVWNYSMIHLTCNITNLYCSVRWHDRELCNSLFERVFICIYAIPHLYTYLWCQFHHFHIQNEVSHATNLPRKFSFQKVREDLDCKEEHSQVAKLDPIGFC